MTDTNQQTDNTQRDMKFYGKIIEAISDKKVAINGEMEHFFKVVFAFAADLNEKILLFFDGDLADTPPCQHENGDLPDLPAIADIHSRLVGMATGHRRTANIAEVERRAKVFALSRQGTATDRREAAVISERTNPKPANSERTILQISKFQSLHPFNPHKAAAITTATILDELKNKISPPIFLLNQKKFVSLQNKINSANL